MNHRSQRSRFRLEQLEPRLLLSADATGLESQLPGGDETPGPAGCVEAVTSASPSSSLLQPAEEASSVDLTDASTWTVQQPLEERRPSSQSKPSRAVVQSEAQTKSASMSHGCDGQLTLAPQLIETLKAANGPPPGSSEGNLVLQSISSPRTSVLSSARTVAKQSPGPGGQPIQFGQALSGSIAVPDGIVLFDLEITPGNLNKPFSVVFDG